MDLKRLRYFVCIGELGSFTLAARRLGVAQPALSRHVQRLETECGAPLLRRNGRGAQLSDLGRFVYEQARLLLEQMDRLESGLMASKVAPTGSVVLGMPPSVCMILVEPLYHRVRQSFPGIRLHICEGFSGDVREWLLGGRLDIGVLYQSGRAPTLIGSHLLVEDMFLCTAASDDDGTRTITLADAMRHELILPGRPHGLRILVDSVCAEAGLMPNVVLMLDSMATIKNLVRSTDAASILPYCGVYREVEQGQLTARRIVDSSITRTLVVAETIRRPKTPATQAVVRCLRDEVTRLMAAGLWTGRDRNDEQSIPDRPL